jgi:hypothetical protein
MKKDLRERSLNDKFLKDLLAGELKELLSVVKKDSTIDLQFRGNSVDIYYRGGKILHLIQNNKEYTFQIDESYFKNGDKILFSNLNEWINQLALIKQARDFHYTSDKNTAEREFQQLIIRTNNYERTSNSTDFFITDMEYDFNVKTSKKEKGQIDLIGIEWNTSQRSKNGLNTKFVFIEVKFGNNAVKGGKSGLNDHLNDIKEYLTKYPKDYQSLLKDTLKIFQQKRDLELYTFSKDGNSNEITKIEEKPTFLIILADYKNKKNNLYDLITQIDIKKYKEYFDLRFAISSFMGYGLYSDCLLTHSEILEHIKSISDK